MIEPRTDTPEVSVVMPCLNEEETLGICLEKARATIQRLGLSAEIVVADNGWAISVPAREQAPASIDQLVSGFPGLQIFDLNGTDYFASRRVGERAIAWVRRYSKEPTGGR